MQFHGAGVRDAVFRLDSINRLGIDLQQVFRRPLFHDEDAAAAIKRHSVGILHWIV